MGQAEVARVSAVWVDRVSVQLSRGELPGLVSGGRRQ